MRDFTQCTKESASGFGDHALRGIKSIGYTAWRVMPKRLPQSILSFVALCVGIFSSLSVSAQTTPATNIVISPISAQTARIRFDWQNGDGVNRIVILKPIAASYTPSGAAPASNPNYGAGADLGGGTKCVFNSATDGGGGVTTVTVTGGLTENTDYTVQVYEYTGTTYVLQHGAANPVNFRYRTTTGLSANWWTAPSGINSVVVQAWGGGGAGGGADEGAGGGAAGGGGAGGVYARSVVSVTSGNQYDVNVGAGGAGVDAANGGAGGDSYFLNNSTILAKGGAGGLGVTTGGGTGGSVAGTITGSIGTTRNKGGDGAAASSSNISGGGGTSGGTIDDGTSGSGSTGGAGEVGGGNGADGRTGNGDGATASFPGGGGGGGVDASGGANKGGDGGNGLVLLSWSQPQPTISILGSNPTIGAPVFRVKFSSPINTGSFIDTDVSISGTTPGTETAVIAEIAPNDGTTFSITVSGMTGSGTVIVALAAGVVNGATGNTSLASNTGTTINYTHIISGATVNPNAGNVIIGQPITVTLTAAGAQTGLLAGSPSTINGINVVGSFAEVGGGTYTYTYTPSNTDPTWALNALPINLRLSDGTNTSLAQTTFTGGSASATDLTRPAVNSNSVGTITPTGVTFTINLTEIGTTYWEITTSATPPTPAQIKAGTGTGHVSMGNFAVGTASSNINQAIAGLTAATSYFIYSVSEDGVTNQSTPVTSNSFTTLCAPPTAQPTAAGSPFTSILANSMTFNWVRGDGTGGVLVVARQGSAPTFVPSSGSTYAGQVNANFALATDQGGGDKILYRGSGTSVPITGLTPSTTYHFAVYEWNTINDCYLTTSPYVPAAQATIAVANEATLTNATGTATLSSLAVNTGSSVALFSFDVTDAGADGADTRITQMIFRPGTGNDFANLTHLISSTGAELYDNAGNGPAGTVTVGTNAITFASIPAATSQLGNIPNGTTKRYTLRVFFNNPINAAIRATADEENLVLDLANADVTTTAGFSGMAASSVTSGASNGAFDVVATNLAFVTGPVNTFLLVPMASVTVEATDIHGSRDNGFTSSVGITSTGTLSVTPVNATFVAGLGTYSTIVHSAIGTGRTLTTNSGTLSNPVSGTFNITASNASDIVVDGTFVYPTNIAYDTYQESSNIAVSGTSLEVGRFTIRDGGGVNDADQAPTILSQVTLDFGANFALLRRVELYDAAGTTAIPGTEFPVSTQNITFSGLSLTANDNSTASFTVRVSFRSLVTDNAQFSITVATPTSTQANVSSTFPSPAGAVTSTAGNNNRVEVAAAQYRFIQQPTSTDVDATMSPSPTVEAVDALLNRDIDYVATVDVLSTGSLTASPESATFSAGVGTYSSVIHNLSGSGLNLVTNGPLANTVSSAFQIVAKSSNITESAFVYPSNIAYNNFQESVNLTSGLTSLVVASFDINDGGNAFPDGDLAPTVLTNLTLDLGPNYTFIRRIALYNATGLIEIGGTEQVVGSQTVSFGGLALTAPDDGSTTFTVRVSFNAPIIDRQQFSITVASATSQAGNSRFTDPDAGGAVSSTAADNNRIQVTATRMMFIQQPTNTLNGVTMSPAVTVGAADALGSIDIDFTSAVDITSNGVMAVTPQTAVFANGIGTYGSIVHTSNGAGLALTTNSILTNAVSNTFTVTSSASSDIIANAAFVYPTNIAYQNFQEAFNITNGLTSLNVARFDLRDGGGAADPDQAPTVLNSLTLDLGSNFSFIRRIALYDASGTIEILGTEQPVVSQFVNFSGLSITTADGAAATSFTVRVSFQTVVTDNQQFSFTVTAAATSPNISSTFALPTAGGATSSITGDRNRIEVTASQITFSTNLSSPLLAGINVSSQQATPVVRTVDVFGNIDRDYGTTLNISCPISISSNTLAVDVAPPNGGTYTFPAGFQYTPQTGNGTLTVSIAGLTSAISNPVTVQAGTGTEIVAGALAPATISSLTNASPGVTVFTFDVVDDRAPLAVTSNDGIPTRISQMVFTAGGFNTITDWTQAIAGARLTDGTAFLDVTAAAVSGSPNSITFTGIPNSVSGDLGFIGNDATKTYQLRIYLNTAMNASLASTIDGLQFDFAIFSSNITLAANSTFFDATTTSSGNRDVVDVTATRLRFLNPITASSASLNSDFPGGGGFIQIEATDANNNRDRNFTGASSTVRELTNGTAQTMINAPTVGITQFGVGANAGLLNFATNFRYTTGSNGQDVTLTVKAGPGPGTTCGVNGIICVSPLTTPASPTITLLSSFESVLMGDPTFVPPTTLDYVNHLEAADIQNTSSSQEIARMILVDGSRVAPPFTTFTDSDGLPNGDTDGANTVITQLTLRVTKPSNIRRIALYSGGAEIPGSEINALSQGILPTDPFHDFVFPVTITALDDNQRDISVRVSYREDAANINDGDLVSVQVVGVVTGVGSAFYAPSGSYIGGINGGTISTAIKIDVVATKLDFATELGTPTQPAPYAGIAPEPVTAGLVEAHDQKGLLDLDFNFAANVTAPVPVSASLFFNQGKLDLAPMLYNGVVGDGTVTVSANGITSNETGSVNGLPNVSVSCAHVDVIHVSTSLATGGVVTTTNLAGNSVNHIIYGVTFKAQAGFGTVAPEVAPVLNSFVISFSNSITNVFNNPRVYESTSTTFNGATAIDITDVSIGGNLSVGSTTITVNFPTARNLNGVPNSELTYFLRVDIDPNASAGTPTIQPTVVDGGSGSPTNTNIVTNRGSATSSGVAGQTYSFAAVFPPVLISSVPFSGQLNVDPALGTISLTFGVPVWSLDQKIRLYNQTNNNSFVVCTLQGGANNGSYNSVNPLDPSKPPVNTLVFNIPGAAPKILPNNVYYVTIDPGNLSTLTGIMDGANNTYPGFSYPGTLYFKGSSSSPPNLLSTSTGAPSNPFISNATLNGATINATFDQQGTAYYLVLKAGATPPSRSQVKFPGTYGAQSMIGGAGSFNITQTNPISQFSVINPNQPVGGPPPIAGQFLPNQQYDVWIFAENNAQPLAVPATAPYGSIATNFAVTANDPPAPGTPPTLQFTTPAANPASLVGALSVRVCNDSYQFINQPIVITESNITTFATGGTSVNLNIGLPAGFQFDVSRTGGVPTYAKLDLIGSDFIGTGSIDFLGNSIVTISFASKSAVLSTSLDKIIISNLRVLATESTSGFMFRIGGTALTGAIPDGFNMGTLSSFDAPLVGLDNSYSRNALGRSITNVVTAIPDNMQDDSHPVNGDPSPIPFTVALFPTLVPADDFGPTSFSGLGVNINILSLQAVAPDVPFNVTVTHADNNGCVSNNTVQYTVYDNTSAVNITKVAPTNPFTNTVSPSVKGPYTIVNSKFVNYRPGSIVFNPETPGLPENLKYVAYNNLAGFYLRNTPLAAPDAIVTRIPTYAAPTQKIYGPTWATNIINGLAKPTGTQSTIGGSPPLPTTQNFVFDAAEILNAPNFGLPDPYSHFRAGPTPQGNFYYNGGSLGVIEMTGNFQSVTNATVQVPRAQQIEFFVPPVPVVETSLANRTFLDTSTQQTNSQAGLPVDPVNPNSNPDNSPTNFGTNVYCQAGGVISINGYPAAQPGQSTGRFIIVDAANPTTVIYDAAATPAPIVPPGFIDNGNGTATLNPNLPTADPGGGGLFDPAGTIRNGYRTMKIIYVYKANIAPAGAAAYALIRITPNPVAAFSRSTPATPYVAGTSAACVDQPIQFISNATISSSDPTASIIDYFWNFGDVTSATNNIPFNNVFMPLVPPAPFTPQPMPLHTFAAASGGTGYVVGHQVISNYGCLSGPPPSGPTAVPTVGIVQTNVDVGDLPTVKYKLEGVSTADAFLFNSNDTPVSIPNPGPMTTNNPANDTKVSANDFISQYVWDFGDATIATRTRPTHLADNAAFNNDVVTHTYTTVGRKQINLTVTTNLGCVNSLALQNTYRDIVVLDRKVLPAAAPPTPAGVYLEAFEPGPLGNGPANWQVWGTGKTAAAIAAGAASASWQWGAPPAGVANPAVPAISGAGVWKTSNAAVGDLSGNYNPDEKSALYSPSIDISNLTRPMISFNSVVQIQPSDGVVLEYSVDNLNIADPRKQWYTLGAIGGGEDWYTDNGIAGKPGTQTSNDFGWSRFDNTAWQGPKHVLDAVYQVPIPPALTGPPFASTSKAVFRFAMGSAQNSPTNRGFTLDNVRIGDRTRTILLENFQSTSNPDPDEKSENEAITAFISGTVGTEVVKVNYHLNFPANDPFNMDDPASPSSRALFYGITKTPASILDGTGGPPNQLAFEGLANTGWVPTTYNVRTLQLAQADIDIVVNSLTDGRLEIIPTVRAAVLTGIPSATVLHVAVMEQSIAATSLSTAQQALIKSGETQFSWVVKQLVPSAAGTPFGALLPFVPPPTPDPGRTFGPFYWTPKPSGLYPVANDLAVAVFLQQTVPPYEIYQVEIKRTGITDPASSVTGLEPIAQERILVYPNPANQELTVQLPGPLAKQAEIQLIDQTGRPALRATMQEGSDRKTVNVTDLAGGIYILTVDMGQGVLTRKKVMIVHQD